MLLLCMSCILHFIFIMNQLDGLLNKICIDVPVSKCRKQLNVEYFFPTLLFLSLTVCSPYTLHMCARLLLHRVYSSSPFHLLLLSVYSFHRHSTHHVINMFEPAQSKWNRKTIRRMMVKENRYKILVNKYSPCSLKNGNFSIQMLHVLYHILNEIK